MVFSCWENLLLKLDSIQDQATPSQPEESLEELVLA